MSEEDDEFDEPPVLNPGDRSAAHIVYREFPELFGDVSLTSCLIVGHADEHDRRSDAVRVREIAEGRHCTMAELRHQCVPLGDALRKLFVFLRDNRKHDSMEHCWVSARQWMLRMLNTGHDELANACHSSGAELRTYAAAGVLGEAMWACDAFPTVELDTKTLSSLVAMRQQEVDDDVRSPWRSFVIEMPEDLGLGIPRIMVTKLDVVVKIGPEYEPARGYLIRCAVEGDGKNPTWLTAVGVTMREAGESTVERLLAAKAKSSAATDDLDHRAMVIAFKVVYGVCACMSGSSAVIRRRTGKKLQKIEADAPKPPGQYVVGLPVKLDLSKEVREWREGKATHFCRNAIRWLVHGHWRWQRCGKGLSMVRRKHIEPYWKGPERAAALVRPHVIAGGDHEPADGGKA